MMANTRNRFPGRRKFLKQSAALSASAASLAVPFAGVAAMPKDARAPDENVSATSVTPATAATEPMVTKAAPRRPLRGRP
jgi:hypothetical protein